MMAGLQRWARILRHRWFDEADARRALPPPALGRIEARVAASEHRHGGEIRVCVEAGLPLGYLWRGLSAHERAVTLFGKLRVWDTEHNNGVLIYLLLADRAIEIVADRAVSRQVPAAQWQSIVAALADDVRAGRFEAGLAAAVDAVDTLLLRHFGRSAEAADDVNELPDAPLVL